MSELEGQFELGSGWPLRKDEPGANRTLRSGRSRWFRVVILTIAGLLLIAVGGVLGWHYWTAPHPILKLPGQNSLVSFSPDGLTLAVLSSQDETEIYRVSDGTLLHKLAGGGIKCAWNFDGSLLAVARSNWPDIELWDSRTWTMRKRLSLYDPQKGRPKSDAPYGLSCYSLCFDRWDNLYVVERSAYDWEAQQRDAFPYKFPPASVFWRASDLRSDIPHMSLFSPHFVAISALGAATRLVCSSNDRKGPGVEVWSVQTKKTGRGAIQRKYAIPPLGSKSMPISLTADGRYLVAVGPEKFLIVELFDDHGEVIHAEQRPRRLTLASTIDIAPNAPLAAFMGRDTMSVLEIPSARSVLELPSPGWMTLSPNGRLLAVTKPECQFVGIYRVPQ